MTAFHGFYYTQKEAGLQGLKMDADQRRTMEEILAGPFALVPYRTYWTTLARYMLTYAPQGYIAWNGTSHWLIGNVGRLLGGPRREGEEVYENGVNLIQFNRDRTFTYAWYQRPKQEEDDPIYDLVYTPWDWLIAGIGDEEMFALDDGQVAHLRENMAWTDEVHEELEAKWPREQHWT